MPAEPFTKEPMKVEKIHHVAYRCKDAKETVLWYQKMLNMDFVLAIAEDLVPSTSARCTRPGYRSSEFHGS